MALLLAFLIQTASPPADTTETAAVIETALDMLENDAEDSASLQETIEQAVHRKVRLETASAEALRSIPGISERTVQRLLAWRAGGGDLSEPESLLRAGLDERTAGMLLPFVAFGRPEPRAGPRLRMNMVQRWQRRLDLGKGYREDPPSGYLGSPDAMQWRLGIRLGDHIAAGVTLDKDAGEPLRWRPEARQFGADFTSFYLLADQRGPFERITAGQYTVQAGEGLVAGQGSAGLSSLRVSSSDRVLRPHASSREYSYFNGLAVQSKPLYGVALTGFVSQLSLDARVDTALNAWRPIYTGYHRTQTEYERRKQARERAAGGVAVVRRGSVYGGALFFHTQQTLNVSLTTQAWSVFGGWARSRWEGSFEWVPEQGHRSATVSLAPLDNASVHIRTRRTREQGLQDLRPHTRIGVNSRGESYDYAEWLAETRFRPFPSWTAVLQVRDRKRPLDPLPHARSRLVAGIVEYRRWRWLTLHVRARTQTFDTASQCRDGRLLLPCTAAEQRQSLRIQVEYRHSAALRSRTRLEIVRAEAEEKAEGVLLYQDFRWKPWRFMQLDMRYTLFDATDASARVYMFENDVLYGFGVPSFNGRGQRWYVLARMQISRSVMLQWKLGVTRYEDVRSTGSGRDETQGNRIRETKVLLQWRFGYDR